MGNRNHGLNVLGKNVRRLREESKLTQEALAERANLDPTYISGIERGVRNPSILSLIRVAKALRVTTAKLMENVDDSTTPNHANHVEFESGKSRKLKDVGSQPPI